MRFVFVGYLLYVSVSVCIPMTLRSISIMTYTHLKAYGFIEVFDIQLMKSLIKDFKCCVSADLYAL